MDPLPFLERQGKVSYRGPKKRPSWKGRPADGPDGGERPRHVAGEEGRGHRRGFDRGRGKVCLHGKQTEVASYRKTRRGGKGLINLNVTPKIGLAVAMLGVAEDDLLIVTLSRRAIRIQTKQVRLSGRPTQGVRLINLKNGDKVRSVAKAEES